MPVENMCSTTTELYAHALDGDEFRTCLCGLRAVDITRHGRADAACWRQQEEEQTY